MSFECNHHELGVGIESAEVAEILVKEGDNLEAEQIVMELETEKAVAELPCPRAGKIEKINVSEGDTVKVGQSILTLHEPDAAKEDDVEQTEQEDTEEVEADETHESESADESKGSESEVDDDAEVAENAEESDEDNEQPAAQVNEEDRSAAQAESEESKTGSNEHTEEEPEADADESADETDGDRISEDEELPEPAGPATRRLARSLDVELEEIEGSGPGGRVTQEDVVLQHDAAGGTADRIDPELPDFSQNGPIRTEKLNNIERAAAKNLSRSWRLIPHVTQHAMADVTQLDQDRRKYNDGLTDDSVRKISLTALAVKAVAAALQDFPRFNASIDPPRQEFIIKEHYHIGIAVETDKGLLVPVIRDAQEMSVSDIADQLECLVSRAREDNLTAEEMQGATFTISNQGPVTDTARQENGHQFDRLFTPIIPWPQAASLGISHARNEAVEADGQPRILLPLSLSYDHRINNGADAVRFLERICELFGGSFQLLVEL